jgi:hypothetical protein
MEPFSGGWVPSPSVESHRAEPRLLAWPLRGTKPHVSPAGWPHSRKGMVSMCRRNRGIVAVHHSSGTTEYLHSPQVARRLLPAGRTSNSSDHNRHNVQRRETIRHVSVGVFQPGRSLLRYRRVQGEAVILAQPQELFA